MVNRKFSRLLQNFLIRKNREYRKNFRKSCGVFVSLKKIRVVGKISQSLKSFPRVFFATRDCSENFSRTMEIADFAQNAKQLFCEQSFVGRQKRAAPTGGLRKDNRVATIR